MKIRTLLLSISLALATLSLSAKQIDVMVISGQTGNGHNYEVMAQSLTEIYGSCDTFNMELTLMSQEGVTFDPHFDDYDVVVLTISNAKWSDNIKRRFESYVASGGGVVIIHEANNAFPEWGEYNRIIGLGGWGGRDEKHGDYYYWLDGKMVRDSSPGRGGAHGRRVPFDINIRNPKHPIVKGLPLSWRHYDDELYGLLRGPAENMEILATAYSDKSSKGTGREEPVLMTITYGKGRIFHTVLGHTQKDFTKAVDNKGYQVTLLRGTEWAATGKVKKTAKLTL